MRQPTILITRPLAQAQPLAKQLEAIGWSSIIFPTIDIEPLNIEAELNALITSGQQFDSIIFTSANAVTHGLPLIQKFLLNIHHNKDQLKFIAVGRATASALQKMGIATVTTPEQFSSEGLLANSALLQVKDSAIAIVTGKDGRTLLADTLRQRQARVTMLYCYQRTCPTVAVERTLMLEWQEQGLNTILAPSLESLRNLFALLDEGGKHFLRHCRLLSFSQRINAYAKTLGFKGEMRVVSQPSNQGIIECLQNWEDVNTHE